MTYRSALITGADNGIGAAFARILSSNTKLLLVGCDAEKLKMVALARTESAAARKILMADLAQESGCTEVIAAADAAEVDLVISNADLGARWGRMIDHDPAFEESMIAVNAMAPALLTRALLPGMLARAQLSGANIKRPAVVIISSSTGFMSGPYFGTYAASKNFSLHYAEALAEEMKEKVDILAVCPDSVSGLYFNSRTRFGDKLYHRENIDVDRLARRTLSALGRRKLLVISRYARMQILVSRLLPRSWQRALIGFMVRFRLAEKSG